MGRGGGDTLDRLPFRNLDDDHLRELADRRIDTLHYLASDELRSPLQQWYQLAWQAQRAAWLEACMMLGEVADVVMFKGAVLFLDFFDAPVGALADCDLLVAPEQALTVWARLVESGFRPGAPNRSTGVFVDLPIQRLGAWQSNHYELAPLMKMVPIDAPVPAIKPRGHPFYSFDGVAYIGVQIDVHHGLATDVPVADFISAAKTARTENLKILDPTDHLWFVVSRFYSEVALHGKRTLRELVYAIGLLRERSIDWDRLVRLCERYNTWSSTYYPLMTLAKLGLDVPLDVCSRIAPDANGSRERDFGWQLGKLFGGLEPFPSAAETPQDIGGMV